MTELIEALTEICIRQAAIIKDQAFALAELGAETREDEAVAMRNRLLHVLGERDDVI